MQKYQKNKKRKNIYIDDRNAEGDMAEQMRQ